MSDDTKKEILETIEAVTDSVSQDHQHGCVLGDGARSIRDSARSMLTEMAAGEGPAQVATKQYRDNYDTIFGKKQTVGVA